MSEKEREVKSVKPILERLKRVADHEMTEEDIDSTNQCLVRLMRDGWTANESFRYLRWSEEVIESSVSEDRCLDRMAAVRDVEGSPPEEAVSKLQDVQKQLKQLPEHERRDPAVRYVAAEIKRSYNSVIGFEESEV